MINNRKKALIHVAKSKIGMTENEYRDLLGSVGVKSSVNLNDRTFSTVMEHFKKLGFKPMRSKSPAGIKSKDRLLRKITALIIDLGKTNNYVDAMSRHMFRVDAYRWCSADQLYKIVAALSKHQKRVKGAIYR